MISLVPSSWSHWRYEHRMSMLERWRIDIQQGFQNQTECLCTYSQLLDWREQIAKTVLSCQPNSSEIRFAYTLLNLCFCCYAYIKAANIPADCFLLFQCQVNKTNYSYSNNRKGIDSKIKTYKTKKCHKINTCSTWTSEFIWFLEIRTSPDWVKNEADAFFSASFQVLVHSCVGLRSQTDSHPANIKKSSNLRREEILVMF